MNILNVKHIHVQVSQPLDSWRGYILGVKLQPGEEVTRYAFIGLRHTDGAPSDWRITLYGHNISDMQPSQCESFVRCMKLALKALEFVQKNNTTTVPFLEQLRK